MQEAEGTTDKESAPQHGGNKATMQFRYQRTYLIELKPYFEPKHPIVRGEYMGGDFEAEKEIE